MRSRVRSRVRTLLGVTAVLGAAAGEAQAGTDTDQLTVTATVQSGCALSGGTLNFGQYVSGQQAALDAVGQINFTSCTGDLTFELDNGAAASSGIRRMSSGASRLTYQLYRNSTRTAVWSTGTNAAGLKLTEPQSGKIDVYGRIPGNQAVNPGTYSDTVNITLTF